MRRASPFVVRLAFFALTTPVPVHTTCYCYLLFISLSSLSCSYLQAANAMHINHILAAGWSATHDPQQSPNSTIIIAGTQLSPLKARSNILAFHQFVSAETPYFKPCWSCRGWTRQSSTTFTAGHKTLRCKNDNKNVDAWLE